MSLVERERRFLSAAGTVALHSNNTRVIPILDGHAWFRRILAAIQPTTRGDRIYILAFALDDNMSLDVSDPATTIGTILDRKFAEGVDVRIILYCSYFLTGIIPSELPDGISSEEIRRLREAHLSIARAVDANVCSAYRLREERPQTMTGRRPGHLSGAPSLGYHVLLDWTRPNGLHLQNVTIVQTPSSVQAFVGGPDYLSAARDDPQHAASGWHDVGIFLEGPAVRDVWRTFEIRWAEIADAERSDPGRQLWLPEADLRRCTLDDPALVSGDLEMLFNPALPWTSPASAPATLTPLPRGSSVKVTRTFPTPRDAPDIGDNWLTPELRPGLHECREVATAALRAARRYVYIEDRDCFKTDTSGLRSYASAIEAALGTSPALRVVIITQPGAGGRVNSALEGLHLRHPGNVVVRRLNGVEPQDHLILIDDEYLACGSKPVNDLSDVQSTALTAHVVTDIDIVRELRVDLLCDHLRVTRTASTSGGGTVEAALRHETNWLGIFSPSWGAGTRLGVPLGSSRMALIIRTGTPT